LVELVRNGKNWKRLARVGKFTNEKNSPKYQPCLCANSSRKSGMHKPRHYTLPDLEKKEGNFSHCVSGMISTTMFTNFSTIHGLSMKIFANTKVNSVSSTWTSKLTIHKIKELVSSALVTS